MAYKSSDNTAIKDTCTCFLQRFRGKPVQLIC